MFQDQKHVHVAGAGLAMTNDPNTMNRRSFPVEKSSLGSLAGARARARPVPGLCAIFAQADRH
jgi:hypothetical protein